MNQPSTVERYCIGCGTERQVHIETGRCQTCGRATAHTTALPLNGMALAPTAQPAPRTAERLVLAETPQLRRWVQQTRDLADTFKERAAKSDAFAQRFQSEAQTLARAARAFAGLLSQIGIDAPPPKSTSALTARRLSGRWSLAHDKCSRCGRTDRKHKALGLCEGCWTPKRARELRDAAV